MLKTMMKATLTAALVALPLTHAFAKPEVGKPAPGFEGMTATGEKVTLADLRGKTVVLEWTNKDCPYVRKHYGTENMQALQRDAKSQFGVTWVSVISSAPGTQGYLDPAEALANIDATKAAPDHLVLDPAGTIGHAYAAQTTPHMYIIDADGTLKFMGGIDDKPSSNWESVKGANNYVRAALGDLAAGREVKQPVTRPYGCSVKYGS